MRETGAWLVAWILLLLALWTPPIDAVQLICTEEQITTDPADPDIPNIYGDLVVWRDWRNGTGGSGNPTQALFYSFDLQTGVTAQVPVSSGSHGTGQDLHDGVVVWSRNLHEDIFTYDLNSGQEDRITNDAAAQSAVSMWGDNIVWEDYRSGQSEIRLFDRITLTEHLVSAIDHDPSQLVANGVWPSIHGRNIVWQGWTDAALRWDIYLYDMGPDETFGTQDDVGERLIASAPETQARPAVYGRWIAWQDERHGNHEIYAYDLLTDREFRLTYDPGFQTLPRLHGDWLVFNSAGTLWLHDFARGQSSLVAGNLGGKYDVFGDMVVWVDYRSGEREIFVATCEWKEECHDGLDNDTDGLIDFPDDPGCLTASDNSEESDCADGIDNDGDGLTDFPDDPGCGTADSIEAPECQDGIDNDGQVGTDFDGGESILGAGNGDPNGPDPHCKAFSDRKEATGCGLGLELVLVVPLLWAWRSRRVMRRTAT